MSQEQPAGEQPQPDAQAQSSPPPPAQPAAAQQQPAPQQAPPAGGYAGYPQQPQAGPYGQAYGQPYAQPGYPAQQGPYVPQAPRPLSPQDERTWAMMAYLLAIIGGLLAPLIILLVLKDRSAYVKEVAKESLNFQITIAIASLTALVAMIVVGTGVAIISSAAAGILFFLLWLAVMGISVLALVVDVVGAIRANNGVLWRIPAIIRLVK